MKREDFIKAKRIVVKLGTNVLRNDEGYVSLPRIYTFIEDIAGREIVRKYKVNKIQEEKS